MKVRRLLFPHDLGDLCDRAIERLAATVRADVVHVVHVLARIDLQHPAVVWSRDEDEPRRRHATAALARRLRGGPFADAVQHVVVGDPGSRIVELAREVDADLVALPSHGRSGLERLLLGSVAEHVARFAPCPVMVLPPASTGVDRERPPGVFPDRTREEQVDALACEVCDRLERSSGFLSALRVGLPDGEDAAWWEEHLTKRLASCGIEFVDLVFAPIRGDHAEILDARFEERWT